MTRCHEVAFMEIIAYFTTILTVEAHSLMRSGEGLTRKRRSVARVTAV